MRYVSPYCDCIVDVKTNKLIEKCPIHETPNEVFLHNKGVEKKRGNKSKSEMKKKFKNKKLDKADRIKPKEIGQRIIDRIRRLLRR